MNKIKRIVCVIMSVCLFMALQPISSYAANIHITTISKGYLKSCSLEELYSLSQKVERQRDVDLVFEEIIERVSNSQCICGANSTSAVIDNYISFKSASVSNSHVLTIKYEVKANVPTNSYFELALGYEYPTACRTEGTKLSLNGAKKGTYTKTISTKGLTCGISVVADAVAREYRERKCFKTMLDKPFAKKATFQEITKTDVTLNKVQVAIPSVMLFITSFAEVGKLGHVLLKIADAVTIAAPFASQTPQMAVGQYYVTIVEYTSDYKCKTTLKIYSSKESYNGGANPIYSSVATLDLYH